MGQNALLLTHIYMTAQFPDNKLLLPIFLHTQVCMLHLPIYFKKSISTYFC